MYLDVDSTYISVGNYLQSIASFMKSRAIYELAISILRGRSLLTVRGPGFLLGGHKSFLKKFAG